MYTFAFNDYLNFFGRPNASFSGVAKVARLLRFAKGVTLLTRRVPTKKWTRKS
jgi:hypothetical protein